MATEMVAFKKGVLASLPIAKTAGTLYVTTDERAIYLDVDASTRIRLGDFQEFATLTALQANTNPSTTALYYVAELNCLAKWDGTAYVQINPDTGATSVEAVGDGNAVTASSYDPTTRKLTLTKGETFAKAADVTAKIGDLGDKTVKSYVDDATTGIASDEALTALANRVTTAESDIDTLQGDKTVDGSVDKKIDDAVATLNPKIEAAKKAGDDAQSAVDTLAGKVGTVPEGKTVVQMIGANETAIATLNGDATQAGSVAKQVADAVAAIVADAPDAYDTLKEISDWISGHANDASAMNTQITTNKTDIAALKALVGALPESATAKTVVAYIDEVIEGLSIGDYAKAADLTAAVARITTLEDKAHEHTNKDALDGITTAKITAWDAAEQNAKNYTDTALAWGTF